MLSSPVPARERQRLEALARYEILDTLPEPGFDALTRIAANILGVPIALVSLVDTDRQWFKSRYGLDAPQTPRDVSFCGHVVAGEAPLIVGDALEDERFSDNPLVVGQPRVRFYAGMPLRTSDGFVLGTLCAIDHEPREITPQQYELLDLLARQVVDQLELRRRQRLLEEREAALARHVRFFELSLELLCTADATLHFHELNPAWEGVLGWTLAELRTRPILEFVHPDDRDSTVAAANGLLNGQSRLVDFENRYRHKDGGWITLSWVAALSDGTFYAAARDVSAYRRQDAALKVSEARLRGAIDAAVDAIVTIDASGTVTDVNPAVERVFGYLPAELRGSNVSALMPSPDRERHDGYLERYRRTGVRSVIGTGREVTARRKDGSTFPAELSVSEFRLDGQAFFTGTIRDITERKRIERLQSEFVSTVSHELRTPLTSIRGSLGLLASGVTGALPDEAASYVRIALSNSDRLVRLINDILDLEKMHSGQIEFRMKTLDLAEAVRSSVSANAAFASAHRVRIALEGDLAAGEVVADEDRLAQVLANLISNAAKFSPEGETVRVRVIRAGDYLRVDVQDRGPGIPDAFRSRIFQRFAQADASSTRQKGGTGLGLNIARAIVEKMRGRIGFDSIEGQGTCFYFELPYVAPLAALSTRPCERPLVLVCEDDPDVARMLRGMLAAAGFDTHVAPTLERARQLYEVHRYAAATIDLILADGDATALIGELRARASFRNIPIVVVSGFGARETRDHLGSAVVSVADIITKPFDQERLLAAVRTAISCGHLGTARVLHVEDDTDLRRIIHKLLPSTWSITSAESVGDARALLAANTYDLVLLDLSLPDGGGEQLIDEVGRAQVIIFSALEAGPALAERVSAALVKSRVSELQLRDLLIGAMADHVAPARA